jgi:hypothetical protein
MAAGQSSSLAVAIYSAEPPAPGVRVGGSRTITTAISSIMIN